METIMNQLLSPELIPDYMHAHPEYGVKRILTYTVYRFLSFAGKEDDTLAAYIKENVIGRKYFFLKFTKLFPFYFI